MQLLAICQILRKKKKPAHLIFSSALCYCTANPLSWRGRPSSLCKTRFLANREAD